MNSGYFFGIISGFLWAVSGILYGILNHSFPESNSIKIILTILLVIELTPLFFLRKKHIKNTFINNPKTLLGIFSGILGGPIGMLCYLYSIQKIGIEYTAPITSMYPIFGSILAFIFLKDSLHKLGILGLLIAIICSSLLGLNITHTEFSGLGILLAFIAAICWGSEIVLSSYVMKYINSSETYLLRQTGSALGYVLIIVYLKIELLNYIELFSNTNFNLILLGICASTIISYLLYYKAIYLIQPIRAMILNITYGIWTVFISHLIYKEPINIKTILFIAGITLGACLVLIEKRGNE